MRAANKPNRTKNKYGQYFTPKLVADFMLALSSKSKDIAILEPACGEGIFLETLEAQGFSNITAYEIDKSLPLSAFDYVHFESFVSAEIEQQFDLIIGNPPYIRWKNLEEELKTELASNSLWNKYCNNLCDYLYIFIIKSIELLKEGGELIFICPEYWMNTTHSLPLRNYMVENGYFECIYHFNETPIFSKASVAVIIFKFIKSKTTKRPKIRVSKIHQKVTLSKNLLQLLAASEQDDFSEKFEVSPFQIDTRWLLTKADELAQINAFEKACSQTTEEEQYSKIGDICEIGNGLVSGLDKAFRLYEAQISDFEREHTLRVVKAQNLKAYSHKGETAYIFLNHVQDEQELIEGYPNFYKKLIAYQSQLENRYQYKRKINYWEWVFLRNFKLFSLPQPRIFVPCKERISNKDYFRFCYVDAGIYPTQDVTALFLKTDVQESIYYVLAFLNNHRVFTWLKNKGIVKGNIVEFSEKPLTSIPFRCIQWQNAQEVAWHNEISKLSKAYIDTENATYLEAIDKLFDELLGVYSTK